MHELNICRLCVQEGDKHKDLLHKKQSKILRLIEKIFDIFIISTDDSHFICSQCYEVLQTFRKFYEEIHDAQIYFSSKEEILQDDTKVQDIKDEFSNYDPSIDFVKKEIDESTEDNLLTDVNPDEVKLDNEQSDSEQLDTGSSQDPTKQKTKRIDRDKAINDFFNFTCPECSLQVTDWKIFRQHLIEEHSNTTSPVIKCCDLQVSLDRKQLLGHVDYHKNPDKLRCKWCGRQFVNVDSKRVHEWRHKSLYVRGGKKDPSRRKPCVECGKILADKSSFKKHMQLHLSNEEKEKLKAQCDLCKRFFRDKAAIFIHIKEMHLPQEKSFSCDQCAKVFPNCRTFNIHYKAHHSGDNMVVCPDCGVEIKAVSLRRHRRLKHDTVSQTCSICMKEFKNRTSLMLHQGRVHVEPKYDCDLCGRMFKEKSKFKEHRESHFNLNRFSCDQCEYINNDYANMLKHRKTKHADAPPLIPGSGRKVLQVR